MRRLVAMSLLVASTACGPVEPASQAAASAYSDPFAPAADGKADTGWLGNNSYEVDGEIVGAVSHAPASDGEYAALGSDPAQQEKLVDTQLKYLKNQMATRGYHIAQIAETTEIVGTTERDGQVSISYRARVNLLRARREGEPLPTLREL